jgi:hypothetical protein
MHYWKVIRHPVDTGVSDTVVLEVIRGGEAMNSRFLSSTGLAVVMCASVTGAYAVGVSGQGSWETTLQARDLDGNTATVEAYYDTVLDITWMANADLAASLAPLWSVSPLRFGESNSFINVLNQNSYLGYIDWRLPTMLDTSAPDSELSSLWYGALGNTALFDSGGNVIPGGGLTNTGPFSNVQGSFYWTSTYATNPTDAWAFAFGSGSHDEVNQGSKWYAWPVRSGDSGTSIPSAVPVPAALWLFGSGLLGLAGVARRRTA